MKKEEMYKKGTELLILGLRVVKPNITDKEAKQFIINIGNWLQLEELKENTSQLE